MSRTVTFDEHPTLFRPWRIARSAPLAVHAVTLAFAALMAVYSVAAPVFHAPDEPNHFDMVLQLRHDALTWPLTRDSRVSDQGMGAIAASPYGYRDHPFLHYWGVLRAAEALPPADRPTLEALHGPAAKSRSMINQMPQHPPLFYLVDSMVLRLVPGTQHWRWDHVLGLLRLMGGAMLLPLPTLVWAMTRRMLGRPDLAIAASVIPLAIPTLTHLGGAVTNDDLLIPLCGFLALALAYVHRGDLTVRTAAWVGTAEGLALFTKGFAMTLAPWVALTYAYSWHRRRKATSSVIATTGFWRLGAILTATTTVAGGWWLIVDLMRYGTIQPSGPVGWRSFPLGTGQPHLGRFLWYAARQVTWQWWGSFGFEEARVTSIAAIGGCVVLGSGILAAFARAVANGGRRADFVFLVAPTVLLTGSFVVPMTEQYLRTGVVAGLHGRYLYAGLVPVCVAVARGSERLPRRLAQWLPAAILSGAVAMQVTALDGIAHHFWIPHGAGFGEGWRDLTAYAQWPSWVVAGLFIGALTACLLALAATLPPRHPSPRTGTRPTIQMPSPRTESRQPHYELP
ncbi:MAG: hypothetical protein ACQSGP_22630 [Frankia sp.]